MSQEKNGRIRINPTLLISLLVLTGSIVASHFTGLAQGQKYTDEKIEKSNTELRQEQNKIKDDVSQVKIDVAVIRQILVQAYGVPKCDPTKGPCL